ncbi:MAG: RimK family alpha-L-glutamate ligase [Candidatus Aenigmarchaeota archaeon]|nr:RimK family alpha-L-glutamate ligase [Candidatus Aenigmarchaeota archaeon]
MKLLFLAPGKISKTSEKIIMEAERLFTEVDLIRIRDLAINAGDRFTISYNRRDLIDYDYLLPRIDSKRASFGHHVMKFFDALGTKKPYTADAIRIAHNKFATIWELKKAGLPVPDTYYTASKEAAERILDRMDYPAVIKLVGGFGGKGVMFAESKETAESIVNTLDLLRQELLIEKFIENPGEDIRVLIIGDEVVSMKRIAKTGEKRANIYAGGRGISHRPSEEQIDISFKAAEIIKADICAVDIIEGKDGPFIIELNINPGISGITKATGENVAQKIARYIYEEAKR